MLNKKEFVKEDLELFNAFPNNKTVKKMWNLPESNLLKFTRQLIMDHIKISHNFYLDPLLFYKFFPKEKNILSKFSKKVMINPNPAVKLKMEDLLTPKILKNEKDDFSIRLLCPFKIPIEKLIKKKKNDKEFGSKFKKIIIDIHGGAFIGTTSSYHQSKLKSIFTKNSKYIKNSFICNRLSFSSIN